MQSLVETDLMRPFVITFIRNKITYFYIKSL